MFPTQITLRHLRSSPAVSVRVRDLCEKLGHIHPRIQNCRVAIEHAPEHPYSVEVRLRLPSSEIVTPPLEDEELDVALRKAFATVRKQLREAALPSQHAVAR